MTFKPGNDGWKQRKANKGGRPRKTPVAKTPEAPAVVDVQATQALPDDDGVVRADVSPSGAQVEALPASEDGREIVEAGDRQEVVDDSPNSEFPLIVHVKKNRFLRAYAELGNILDAAAAVKVSRSAHYKWIASDPGYAQAFETTRLVFSEKLVKAVHERALREDKPSDILLMFATKAARPEFKDNYRAGDVHVNISGNDSKVQFNFDKFRQLLTE